MLNLIGTLLCVRPAEFETLVGMNDPDTCGIGAAESGVVINLDGQLDGLEVGSASAPSCQH